MAVVEAWIGGGKKIVDPHDVSQFSRMLCYLLIEVNFLACKCQLLYWSLQEDNLVLLAIIGLKDPCLPGVKDAIQLCQKAGVEPLFGKREIGGGERMKFICGVWCEKKRMEIFLKMVGLTILFEK
ncbi:Calcium-transporting ATPase 10, plasma membrane-type [Glycine max]|nr:Calcium-transporting ATPase 10, plasma membrane-type [Glycine max]